MHGEERFRKIWINLWSSDTVAITAYQEVGSSWATNFSNGEEHSEHLLKAFAQYLGNHSTHADVSAWVRILIEARATTTRYQLNVLAWFLMWEGHHGTYAG